MKIQSFNLMSFLQRYSGQTIESLPIKLIHDFFRPFEGVYLAGGALRKTLQMIELDSDVDLFFKDKESFDKVCEHLKTLDSNFTTKDNNISFNIKIGDATYLVQCINIAYYASMEALLDSFDYTLCQFGYDGENLYCGEYSLWDLALKRIAVHKLTYGISSLRRLLKYTKQGFTVCNGALATILKSAIENPEIVDMRVVSVD